MKIPIKKYTDDPALTWEERYNKLQAHHLEETAWLIKEIKKLEGNTMSKFMTKQDALSFTDNVATRGHEQLLEKIADDIYKNASEGKYGLTIDYPSDENVIQAIFAKFGSQLGYKVAKDSMYLHISWIK